MDFIDTKIVVLYGDSDAIQWIRVVLIALILSISCCCCCVAGLFYKYLKRKKQINAMITIQSVPCDVDLEREKVALWMRYTVQLPQYVHLFISQGFDTMETLQCIKCKADLHAVGIECAVHQTFILTEIKRLQGADVVPMDDGHATKPAVLGVLSPPP
eukprot:954639_1